LSYGSMGLARTGLRLAGQVFCGGGGGFSSGAAIVSG